MRRLAVCAGIVALFVASGPVVARRHAGGRPLSHPAYAEIAGRPNEIAEIKAYAAKQGWAVVCDQRVGQQSTIRLRFPAGTSLEAIEKYLNGGPFPGRGSKVNMIYYGMPTTSPGCVLLP